MAKKSKINAVNLVVLGVLVICLVLAIVGVSVDNWIDVKVNEDIEGSIFGDTVSSIADEGKVSFGDLLDEVTSDEFKESMEYYQELIDKLEESELDKDTLDAAKTGLETMQKEVAIVAFGLITVLLLAIAVIACVLSLFVNIGFLRFVVLVAGVLALITGIIAIALTGSFIDLGETLGNIADATVKPVIGAGAALLAVGGILGGIAGGASFFFGKKKK